MRDALGPDAARVRLVAGDAADPAWCRSVRQQLEADGRRLDLLVLSACPPPAKVPLVEGSVEVAATYLTRALDLVRTPLTVLAEPVARAAGRVVAISSRWATAPEPGWFPYVAAKAATEGLLRAAAAEYPDAGWAVIRPGRLRTAFNATPMATEGVERVEPVAARLVGRLAEPLTPGVLHVLD
jgi:NAD(P)-dependent dehydrogenase (short-subunit alcohol dehydrogenase family)